MHQSHQGLPYRGVLHETSSSNSNLCSSNCTFACGRANNAAPGPPSWILGSGGEGENAGENGKGEEKWEGKEKNGGRRGDEDKRKKRREKEKERKGRKWEGKGGILCSCDVSLGKALSHMHE